MGVYRHCTALAGKQTLGASEIPLKGIVTFRQPDFIPTHACLPIAEQGRYRASNDSGQPCIIIVPRWRESDLFSVHEQSGTYDPLTGH